MKKMILLTGLLVSFLVMDAQTTWSISNTGKTVLKNVGENSSKNVIKIKKSALQQSGNITIRFTKNDKENIRTVMVNDIANIGIGSWENVTAPIVITNAALKKLFNSGNKINFYFTEIPSDPEKAALVRVRMIHLVTIVLQ